MGAQLSFRVEARRARMSSRPRVREAGPDNHLAVCNARNISSRVRAFT